MPEKPGTGCLRVTYKEGRSESGQFFHSFRGMICPVSSGEPPARAPTGKLQHHAYFNEKAEIHRRELAYEQFYSL